MYRALNLALSVFFFMAGTAAAQGAADAGKTLWDGQAVWCRNCHGNNGEGGFGPDLAGRQLTIDQFRRAVRQPWGIMPAFVEEWVTEQNLADMLAYLNSLPQPQIPGAWRTPLPAGASLGQTMAIANAGCAQCHGANMAGTRQDIGGISADFEWFKAQVYEHSRKMPEHRKLLGEPNRTMRMGNYSPSRLPESVLSEIWTYTLSLGSRAYITAEMNPPESTAGEVTYSLTVDNGGLPGKGVSAENVSIIIVPAAGFTVSKATGDGYQGMHADAATKATAAIWKIAKIGPREPHTISITFVGTATGPAIARAEVRWERPVSEGKLDSIGVAVPRAPEAQPR
jgi:mono/diheme cytochrome c family protein